MAAQGCADLEITPDRREGLLELLVRLAKEQVPPLSHS